MNFIPMIPAESLFRATHAGEGHKLVVHIEAGTRGGVERQHRLSQQVLSCEPCGATLRFPFIEGIYWDPFREPC